MNYSHWKAALAAALDPAVERSAAASTLSLMAQQEEQVGNALSGFREFVERRVAPLDLKEMEWLRDHFLANLKSLDRFNLGMLKDLLDTSRPRFTEEAAQTLLTFIGERNQQLVA